MGLDAEDVDEILEFLGERRGWANGQRLLDASFAPKPQLEARKIAATRFSDGSIRVFYSSLEPETAELEVNALVRRRRGRKLTTRRLLQPAPLSVSWAGGRSAARSERLDFSD